MRAIFFILGLTLFLVNSTAWAGYTTYPTEILYRLWNKQSMYEYIKGSGEETWGDLAFNGDAFYGAYTKDNGYLQSSMLFCKFDDSALLANAPVEISDPDQMMWGPRLAWNGTAFGLAYSSMYKGKFRLISPSGVATNPIELPKMIYTPVNPLASPNLVQVAALKPVWTGAGFLVFGLVLEPDQNNASQFYNHLCLWRLDAQGNLISSREVKNTLYGMIYEKYRGMEHGWYNISWSGGRLFLAYLAWDGILPTTLYQMLDLNGNTVVAEQRAWTADKTIMSPVIAWSGTSFALTGYSTDIQSGISDYYIRLFNGNGAPLATEQQYNAGDPTLVVHNAVSWLGDKFVAAYPTVSISNYTAIVRLAAFNAAGQRLASNYNLIEIGDSTLDYNWLTLGTQLKLVGDGDRTMVQGRFYHLFEQRFTPLIYRAVGDVVTPSPPIMIYPAFNTTLPWNSVVPFQWEPVAKNNQYRFQLANDSAFTDLLADRLLTDALSTSINMATLPMLPTSTAAEPTAAARTLYWRVKGSNTGYSPTASFNLTAAPTYRLDLTISGTGGGTIISNPAGINCLTGTCNATFNQGTSVTLTPYPNKDSLLGSWSTCAGTDTCTVLMNADKQVTATFNFVKPVKLKSNGALYSHIKDAYTLVIDNGTILTREYSFTESPDNLTLNRDISVRLEGGYDAEYATKNGFSTLDGALTIGQGTLTLENLIIK